MTYLRYLASGLTAAAAATVATVYGIYRYGFYSPRRRQNDDHKILIPMSKEQLDRSIAMIDKLNARPY